MNMLFLILGLVLAAAGVTLLVLRRTVPGVVALVAGGLAVVAASLTVIPSTSVGVPVTFGTIGNPLQAGINLKLPVTDVVLFSTRPVDLTMNNEDAVEIRAKDGNLMYVDVTVKYAVDAAQASELFRLAGDQEAVQERLVRPDAREIVRNVFASYGYEESIGPKREEIGAAITSRLAERLADRGIDVTIVNLRDVRPSDQLQALIERKTEERENAERAILAKQTAQAEAERVVIEAQGKANANKVLAQSLSPQVLAAQCIEAWREAVESSGQPIYTAPCDVSKATQVIVDGTTKPAS